MKFVKLEEVTSTNDELKKLAAEGAGSLTIVTADKQTAGRGRNGNEWESDEGNLFISILLRDIPPLRVTQISLVAALAVVEVVESFLFEDEVTLKWPNDVLVNGKKIAGILLESEFKGDEVEYVIAGVGLNIASNPDYATSFKACGEDVVVKDARDLYIEAFKEYLQVWLQEGFERIGNLWMQYAAFLDEEITVNSPSGEIKGIFKGLSDMGEMVIERDGKEEVIPSGEVAA